MSLKWLLGGEVNYKYLAKERREENEWWEARFKKFFKAWNKSVNGTNYKIIELINNFNSEPNPEPDFPRKFFFRYPDLLNDDEKVFASILLPTLGEDERDKNCFTFFTSSKTPLKEKIANFMEASKQSHDQDFARRFFTRHPELVPKELNPFLSLQADKTNLKELKLKNQILEQEKEILELKLKLKTYEQSQ